MGLMAHYKTISLTGAPSKNVYYSRYRTYLCFGGTLPIFGGEMQTLPKSNFYGFFGVSDPLYKLTPDIF